jgi:hypothetical protein
MKTYYRVLFLPEALEHCYRDAVMIIITLSQLHNDFKGWKNIKTESLEKWKLTRAAES